MLSSADWERNITMNSFYLKTIKKDKEWGIYYKDSVTNFPCSRILYEDKYYGEVWTYLNESEWVRGADFDVVILEAKVLAHQKLIQMKRKIMESPHLKKMRIIDVVNPNAIFDLFYRDIVTQMADKHFFGNG